MMLSDEDIKKCIKTGELKIEPYREQMLRGSGVLMHLGSEILVQQPGKVVDVKNKITPDYTKIIIDLNTPYPLKPGEFVLGHTYQKVTVGASLGFLIEGRSTLARVGLTIVQTAMLVYPGHKDRTITLELANHGPNTILLYPKMKIARVALFELKTPAQLSYDEKGKYRTQHLVGAPLFEDEIEDNI
jgi:dCTP deaminase